MGAVAIRAVRLARADVVTTALLATVSGALLILLVPVGGDAPAHLYRTLLVRDGVHIWDNLWYDGPLEPSVCLRAPPFSPARTRMPSASPACSRCCARSKPATSGSQCWPRR